MSLYLTLELCSVAVPLILSFDKKVAFYRHWRTLFPAIITAGLIFISADIIFTEKGVWGFNSRYHSGIILAGIPLEEWLFFIIIPYASIFTHYVIISYFPGTFLSDRTTRIITWILVACLSILIVIFHKRIYTTFYSAFMIILLLISLFDRSRLINSFYITWLVILIPFFLVNGILTGSFIQDEVVWYNESAISGFRIFTVPFEDIMYGFSLIFLILLLMAKFEKTGLKKNFSPHEK